MSGAQHTPGPLQMRMDSTCSGAWAEVGQECVDPATQEPWWRELARTETTHIERTGPRGRRLPGPVGTITERPERFVLTPDGEEHIANAFLWAASPDILAELRAARSYVQRQRDMLHESNVNPRTGQVEPSDVLDEEDGLLVRFDAAIAKASGSGA